MPGRNKKYFIYFTLLIAATVLYSCGIFDTRDPETPETVRSTFKIPTEASIVIENMENAVFQKNSDNYRKCISDVSFQFIPDSRSLQNYELIFSTWNQLSEKKYFDNMLRVTNSSSSTVLFLDNRRLTQINSDSAIFQANYIVVCQHNYTHIPKSAKGNVVLSISTDNELFYIKKWEDFRQNDTDFTWSELKANFN